MEQISPYSTNSKGFQDVNSLHPQFSKQYCAIPSFKSNGVVSFCNNTLSNSPKNDYFEGSKKKNKKHLALLFGAAATAAALLAVGFNLDKIKNFFNNAIQNVPQKAAKGHTLPKKHAPKTKISKNKNRLKSNNSIFHRKQNWSTVSAGAVFTPNATSVKNYENILAITRKNKLESSDFKEIERIFKQHTGINLYCPESYNFKDFEGFFEPMLKYDMYDRISPDIKHIILGHGTGSALQGNWRFEGNKMDVFDFVEKCIPKGEKALLVTCESSKALKPGLGGPVNISLHAQDRPGKVVESGIRRIIGSAYLLEPNIIKYF